MAGRRVEFPCGLSTAAFITHTRSTMLALPLTGWKEGDKTGNGWRMGEQVLCQEFRGASSSPSLKRLEIWMKYGCGRNNNSKKFNKSAPFCDAFFQAANNPSRHCGGKNNIINNNGPFLWQKPLQSPETEAAISKTVVIYFICIHEFSIQAHETDSSLVPSHIIIHLL